MEQPGDTLRGPRPALLCFQADNAVTWGFRNWVASHDVGCIRTVEKGHFPRCVTLLRYLKDRCRRGEEYTCVMTR